MTREASAAMRKLVEAFDSAYCAEHEMDLRRKFFGDDWSQDVVEAACASRTALLAAIAAQEAATEAAQAEVARLRAAVEAVRGDMSIAAGLSQPPHVVEYAIVIKRLDAALKETP